MGLDLGDRFSYLLGVDRYGEILVENRRLSTTRVGFEEYFSDFAPSETRIICEAGTHSPWVSALLEEMGFEVVVANPSHAGRALAANRRKNGRFEPLYRGVLSGAEAQANRIRKRPALTPPAGRQNH